MRPFLEAVVFALALAFVLFALSLSGCSDYYSVQQRWTSGGHEVWACVREEYGLSLWAETIAACRDPEQCSVVCAMYRERARK